LIVLDRWRRLSMINFDVKIKTEAVVARAISARCILGKLLDIQTSN
jgi:hypothetical protein